MSAAGQLGMPHLDGELRAHTAIPRIVEYRTLLPTDLPTYIIHNNNTVH